MIFRVRRPAYLINSTIIVEDGEGTPVGEVHQRWHLWKRKYDLYLERNQFASIEGNFLAWEFVLRNQDGGEIGCVDNPLVSCDAWVCFCSFELWWLSDFGEVEVAWLCLCSW